MAIHIPTVTDEKEFQERLEKFIGQIRKSEKINEEQEVFLPGEKEARIIEERLKEGIPLPQDLYEYLKQF
jgi:ureidoglycolate dehydrogenase (NAD+)